MLKGLPKLIVLDKLQTPTLRLAYHDRQKLKKGEQIDFRNQRDNRTMARMEKLGGSAEVSDYSTVFLPWGPEQDARRTLRLMKKKDLVLNGKWFAKDRTYFLHPCFFGTAEEILEDCSPNDPPIPDDVSEDVLKHYVRGKLKWLEDNPGRQQIGSFNPITEENWEDGAYFLESTSALCLAVNKNDAKEVGALLDSKSGEWDIYSRDFLGRSALHIGIMAGAVDAVKCLVERDGVDPTLRLPDGRNGLHLCAQYNSPSIARALVDATKRTVAKYQKYAENKDSWPEGKQPPRAIQLQKDLLDSQDFDNKLRPLAVAMVFGNFEIAELLVEQGASIDFFVKQTSQTNTRFMHHNQNAFPQEFSPLLLLHTETDGTKIAKFVNLFTKIMKDECSSLVMSGFTNVFHCAGMLGAAELVRAVAQALAKVNPKQLKRLLLMMKMDLQLPINSALENNHLDCAKAFIDCYRLAKCKPKLYADEDICSQTRLMVSKLPDTSYQMRQLQNVTADSVEFPLLTSLAKLFKRMTFHYGAASVTSSTGKIGMGI